MPKYYGKGTVKKLGPKKYFLRLSCGKDPVTGKYRQVTETFIGTKRDAEHRIEEMRQALESGITPNADKMTYAQLSDAFHTAREEAGERRPATLRKDRTIECHIVEIIGEYRIGDITPATLTDLYSKLRAKFRAEGKVGDATVANCHRQVRQILGYAVKARYINFNPATALPATPKQPTPELPRFDNAQIARLYSCISSLPVDAYSTGMMIAFHTGLRLGEICGLTWKDVDLENRILYIERQRTITGEIAPTKTKKSRRSLFINSVLAARLEEWRGIQRGQLEELTRPSSEGALSIDLLRELREKYEQGDDTPVLTNKAGNWLDTPKLSRTFSKVCEDNGIEGLTFHSLRHVYCSVLEALGIDVKTIQEICGWASSAMPMDKYGHGITEAHMHASREFGTFVERIAVND